MSSGSLFVWGSALKIRHIVLFRIIARIFL